MHFDDRARRSIDKNLHEIISLFVDHLKCVAAWVLLCYVLTLLSGGGGSIPCHKLECGGKKNFNDNRKPI